MKFCYIDESGLGSEPYLVMVGVIVDAQRMHRTKEMWSDFLKMLSGVCKRTIYEFHTRDFYAGNGPWRGIDGPERAKIISAILNWWGQRKHYLTLTAIDKEKYNQMRSKKQIMDGCDSVWLTAAVHASLSIQKAHQGITKNKGHTLLLFDNEEREKARLSKFICRPPGWTDEYYARKRRQDQLDQIIDVPFFADSQEVLLLQVADVIAFVLRRYAEIIDGGDKPRYNDELSRLKGWVKLISSRCYSLSSRWPSRGLNEVQTIFDKLAPQSIKKLVDSKRNENCSLHTRLHRRSSKRGPSRRFACLVPIFRFAIANL